MDVGSAGADRTEKTDKSGCVDLEDQSAVCGREENVSRGLKPALWVGLNIRAEARTYLRGNGNGKSNDKGECKSNDKSSRNCRFLRCAAEWKTKRGFQVLR